MLRIKFISGLSSPMFLSHHHSISYHDSFECYFVHHLFVCINESACEIGDIHTAVRLASDPEVVGQQLWESLEP